MALTKDQKTAQVTELATKLKDSQSVMFSHFIGLNVGDVSDLRSQLRENGAEMKVAKKTLIKLAFKEAGLPDITPKEIDGPIGCIMSYEDPLSGAQTAFKFSKDHDKVTLVGGVYDGKLLTPQESMTLAQMPGREELLGMFVGMLRSPLVSFASLCTSPLGGFARALDQMADKGGFVKDEVQTPEVAPEPAEEAEPAAAPEEEAAPAAEETPAAEEAAPTQEPPKTDEAPAASEGSES
ncbi:MAG: 50S ribosomal protein L10 [Candidatus Peribacter sp.]|jgi:large subunit ribosomal protein L10|nr:50S ribosomal protein L10 [Candidatus Peribacter sp.]MBT4393389.1 50S ribosomal protein L10 [Candidatus Peribacter sp.]MBT4600772.1 50S ribosomal protein L10 [Candidatus Peribacter sp.]MBT5149182.1 50S ribosomal protein L10 [Candidatus Peribacter sp.]MBT5637845.1 50S ribosomal protein L10 [Candidatus Peribacter sp.]